VILPQSIQALREFRASQTLAFAKTDGQDGLVKLAKATISTELKFGHDAYNLLMAYWTKGKETVQKKASEAKN